VILVEVEALHVVERALEIAGFFPGCVLDTGYGEHDQRETGQKTC